MPSKESIERELSNYINDQLFFCTKSFVDFPSFMVKQGKIASNVKINQDKVIFNVKYPLTIKKTEIIYNINEFNNINIPIRLGVIYNVTNQIINDQLKDKKNVCISCVANLGIENDLDIELNKYDGDEIIFYIKDNKSLFYEYKFMNKYKIE